VEVACLRSALLLLLFAWIYFSQLIFWGRWQLRRRWLPEAAAALPTPCVERPVRRRGLCLAGEDPAPGVLLRVSYRGGSLPTAAATAVPPRLGASEL